MVSPANQQGIRRHNLGVVLRRAVAAGPASRAAIAVATGLNKSTVSSLVAELIELRLLRERGAERRGAVGRPGLVVELDPGGPVGLGLEVGVDYLAVHASDLAGATRHRHREAGDHRGRPPGAVLDRLGALARTALADLRAQGAGLAGVTVAAPGLVDVEAGVVLVAPNLRWTDVPLGEALADRVDATVSADNEANLAALAEHWAGAGRGLSDFLHVSGAVGVGGGIVLDGELFRGARGFGGEFGHVTVDPGGPPCACGSRGCVEALTGLEALLAASGAPDAGALEARAAAGDPRTTAALRDGGRWLGIAAAGAANLLDLQAVVLGGRFGTLSRWLAAGVAEELRARVLAPAWAVPRVLASELGPEAAVRGAAARVLRGVLADPAGVRARG